MDCISRTHSSRHDSEPAFAAATPCQTVKMVDRSVLTVCLPTADATAVWLSEPQVNTTVENIGARRLHTLMERILEDVSYSAGDAEVTNPNPHMVSSRANC